MTMNISCDDPSNASDCQELEDGYGALAGAYSDGFLLFLFGLNLVVGVLIVLLNGSVLGVLLYQKVHQQEQRYLFLLALLVASGLGGGSVLLMAAGRLVPALYDYWACVLTYNISEILALCVWFNLLFLNIDHLVLIEYPLRYPALMRRPVIVAMVTAACILPFLHLSVFFSNGNNQYYCGYMFVALTAEEAKAISFRYTTYLFLSQYLIPLVVVGTINCRIVVVAHKQRMQIHALRPHGQDGGNRNREQQSDMPGIWKSVLTASIIFGAIFLSYTPFFMFELGIMIDHLSWEHNMEISEVCLALYYLNYLWSPIIYSVRIPEIKKVLRQLVQRCKPS